MIAYLVHSISITDPDVSGSFLHFLAKGRRMSFEWNLTDNRLIVPLLSPRLNLPVLQFYNRLAILLVEVQNSHDNSCSELAILCSPWRCCPDVAYDQSSCASSSHTRESSSHIDGTDLPPCVWIFSSVQKKQFPTLVKMLMEGNEGTFCVTLNTVSWQVLTSASWISPSGQPNPDLALLCDASRDEIE